VPEKAEQIIEAYLALTGHSDDLPSQRFITKRGATCAASPEEEARCPASETKWPNLAVVGGYVQRELPATIEGAVSLGQTAARSATQRLGAA
jgi:hydroxysqualene dehydroxylase